MKKMIAIVLALLLFVSAMVSTAFAETSLDDYSDAELKQLYEKVKEKGETPTEFTALKGSHRNYWFLNADVIERGKIIYP